MNVDISISDDSGPRAARYIVQQARQYGTLKPLVLVLKAYLKSQGLNEVANGGLSSYSLTNMVIVHLQEELKEGRDISDLGETLYGFLLRYSGEEFSYELDAVSVASGGVVPKQSLGFAMETARLNFTAGGGYDAGGVPFSSRLCVDCPLTGREVSSGSFRIDLVREAFARAARNLEALAKGRKMNDTSINYLTALFDVRRIAQRVYSDSQDDYFTFVSRGPRSRRSGNVTIGDPDDDYDDDYEDDVDYLDDEEGDEEQDDELLGPQARPRRGR